MEQQATATLVSLVIFLRLLLALLSLAQGLAWLGWSRWNSSLAAMLLGAKLIFNFSKSYWLCHLEPTDTGLCCISFDLSNSGYRLTKVLRMPIVGTNLVLTFQRDCHATA